MISDAKEPRDAILGRLRHVMSGPKPIFRNAAAPLEPPDTPAAVTGAQGDRQALAETFGSKLEDVSGSYEIVDRENDVAGRIVALVEEWSEARPIEVLSWAPREIPVDNLESVLNDSGISLLVPEELHREADRAHAARLTVGLTAVDAAFASTGSLALAAGRRKSRAASLLPLVHLAIVPMSRIYPTVEAWLASLRRDEGLGSFLRVSGQVAFVTGPSKSADIELNLTLGVHGPRIVHAVLFDDSVR
jgi:L-lactate dehydrogenase complex protein LldG